MINKVKKTLADVLDINAASIDDQFSNERSEKWDSLNHIRLAMALEEEFGVQLTAEEIADMISIPRILAVLGHKTGAPVTE